MRTLLTTRGQLFTASPDMFLPPVFPEGTFSCARTHTESKPSLDRRVLQDEHTTIALQRTAGRLRCRDCRYTLRLTAEVGPAFTQIVPAA